MIVSVGPVAAPNRVVAEASVKISTLCGVPASWLLNAIVNAVPAGAARQFLSKAMLTATREIDVPLGEQAAVGGGIEGCPIVGVGCASASAAPEAGVATSRFRFTESNHATATDFPSGDAASVGVQPAFDEGRGCATNAPLAFVS